MKLNHRACAAGFVEAFRGAMFWRFVISARPLGAGSNQEIAISSHVFPSAEDALDVADLWCAATPAQKKILERTFFISPQE